MPDSNAAFDESIKIAFTVIRSFSGMKPVYRNKCYNACRHLPEPGEVCQELKQRIVTKGLKGEPAAKYFFTALMDTINQ